MDFSVFTSANILLLFLLIILAGRFFLGSFINKAPEPLQWKLARKEHRLPAALKRMVRWYPDSVRFYTWWLQVERLKLEMIPGDFAELGVYKGESASMLHQMDKDRRFHLFDTFEGFPEKDLQHETGMPASYTPRHFSDTSIARVIRRIGNQENLVMHTGYFPDTTLSMPDDIRYALVNIDVDLYLPTLNGLRYFYPRLSPGGVLFIHDYTYLWPGVVKAVDEFASAINECLCFIPDRYGTVMLVKNNEKGILNA